MNGNFAMDNPTVTSCNDKTATVTSGNNSYSAVYNNGLVELSLDGTKLAEVKLVGNDKIEEGPKYYSLSPGQIGGNLPSDKVTNSSSLNQPMYIGLDSEDGKTISAAYLCLFIEGKEYCMKGLDSASYESNQNKLREAYNTGRCISNENGGGIFSDGLTCTFGEIYMTTQIESVGFIHGDSRYAEFVLVDGNIIVNERTV